MGLIKMLCKTLIVGEHQYEPFPADGENIESIRIIVIPVLFRRP